MTTVLSERRTDGQSYHQCGPCSYLMALSAAGFTHFPLGYTHSERDAFSPNAGIDGFGIVDTEAKARYGFAIPTPTVSLAAALVVPGAAVAVAGLSSRLPVRLRVWQPTFAGGHALCFIVGPTGTLTDLDPLAPQGYKGDAITVAEVLAFANPGTDQYRVTYAGQYEDPMQYEYKLERWLLDGGPSQITTVGAPYGVTGMPDYSQRLAVTTTSAGVEQLATLPRTRLTSLTTGPASKPTSDTFWAALVAYGLPTSLQPTVDALKLKIATAVKALTAP